jgi:hypothetical protein
MGMQNARIDISQNLEGEAVVFACFDLRQEEVAAAAHAVAAASSERYRLTSMSGDDVLHFRELTALGDELAEPGEGMRTIVLSPARICALRDAVGLFVETRLDADWIRDEDREPLELLRALLGPLGELCEEATRAALSPEQYRH